MKKLIYLTTFIILASFIYANCPGDLSGSGTLADPCLITNCDQLQNISIYIDSNYTITQEINCTEAKDWNGGKGFEPIGDFKGTLNGSNNTITNLTINLPTNDTIGLFKQLTNANIYSLGIENCNVTGKDYTGCLAGTITGGDYKEIYVTGIVNSTGNYTGAITGITLDTCNLTDIYAHINITGFNYVGGLVGSLDFGNLYRAYIIGNVNGTWRVGGITGSTSVLINSSFSTANVNAEDYLGVIEGGTIAGNLGVGGDISLTYYFNQPNDNVTKCLASQIDADCISQSPITLFRGDVYPLNTPMGNWSFPDIWSETSFGYPVFTWQIGATMGDDTIAPVWNNLPENKTLEYHLDSLHENYNATDNKNLIHRYATNDTNFNMSTSGELTNFTALEIGTYKINISVNDTMNNLNHTLLIVTVTDTLKPSFTGIPGTEWIEYNFENLAIKFNITDKANLTLGTNYTYITGNSSGYILNLSLLTVGNYKINVSVNDTSNNTNSTLYNLYINDTLPPTLTIAANLSTGSDIENHEIINASDPSGLNTTPYHINDTTNFNISVEGRIWNIVSLSTGTYKINVSAVDVYNNTNSTVYYISYIATSTETPSGGSINSGTYLTVDEEGRVLQACIQKETFLDRIKDDCGYENDICEDGETPFDSEDCSLTTDAITCKGERCIFNEIWLAKLLLLSLVFFGMFYKKDYNIYIVVIILILFLGFISPAQQSLISPIYKGVDSYPDEIIENNLILKYGSKILPSNPIVGFFIIVGLLFFAFRKTTKKIAKNRSKRRFR